MASDKCNDIRTQLLRMSVSHVRGRRPSFLASTRPSIKSLQMFILSHNYFSIITLHKLYHVIYSFPLQIKMYFDFWKELKIFL